MLNDSGLSDKARAILFWVTITLIAIVALAAIVTILRACSNIISPPPLPLTVRPDQVDLCPGEQQQFTASSEGQVTWETTGGIVGDSGLYTAGDIPGDYTVTATDLDTDQEAQAVVHVVACAPTPTPEPTALPAPTATPTPEAAAPTTDPPGDVGAYENGVPVTGAPAGVDISGASIAPDMHVTLQPTTGIPAELTGWAAEGEVLLWISLHSPIPDPPPVYMNWLFALDVDGNTGTGRPAGSRRINPDLGDEAVIGVSYDPATAAYDSYFLVWDTAQGDWATGAEGLRYRISDSRTLVAFALPLETLTQSVAQTSGVTLAPEAIKGRAAADSYAGEQRVIDFYPNLP